MKAVGSKFFGILVAVSLSLGILNTTVHAKENASNLVMFYDADLNQEYLKDTKTGEKIYEVFEMNEDGVVEYIPLSLYKEMVDRTMTMDEPLSQGELEAQEAFLDVTSRTVPNTYKVYKYTRKGSNVVNGTSIKVTADVKGPATISVLQGKTVSNSFSGSYALQFSAQMKQQATFQWNTSLSTQKSTGYTFNVSSGKTGYVSFTPYLNRTWGTGVIETRSQNNHLISKQDIGTVYGYSPKKLSNGFADGLYKVVYK